MIVFPFTCSQTPNCLELRDQVTGRRIFMQKLYIENINNTSARALLALGSLLIASATRVSCWPWL